MPPRDWTSPNNDLQFRGDALNRIIIHPLRFQHRCFENSSLSPPWGPQKIWTPDFRPPEAPAPLGDQFCLKHTPFLKWLAAGKSKALRVQTMSVVNGHVSQFWLQFFRKKWGGFPSYFATSPVRPHFPSSSSSRRPRGMGPLRGQGPGVGHPVAAEGPAKMGNCTAQQCCPTAANKSQHVRSDLFFIGVHFAKIKPIKVEGSFKNFASKKKTANYFLGLAQFFYSRMGDSTVASIITDAKDSGESGGRGSGWLTGGPGGFPKNSKKKSPNPERTPKEMSLKSKKKSRKVQSAPTFIRHISPPPQTNGPKEFTLAFTCDFV